VLGSALDTRHLFDVLHAGKLEDLGRLRVIQDVYVPAPNAARFLEYVCDCVGVLPLWLCPVRQTRTAQFLSPHYDDADDSKEEEEERMLMDKLMINVGIYGRPRAFPFDPVRVNEELMERAHALGGRKMLYAQTYYSRDAFWRVYDERRYRAVRAKLGADAAMFDVYDKVCLTATQRRALSVPVHQSENAFLRRVIAQIVLSKARQTAAAALRLAWRAAQCWLCCVTCGICGALRRRCCSCLRGGAVANHKKGE
jgi:hypothetical protein